MNCANGGKKIETGQDIDASTTLEPGEVLEIFYVCDGSDGSDGLNSLVSITDEAAGMNCPNGGKRIDVGQDDDANGVLDVAEIDQTTYICEQITGVQLVG